MRVGMRVVGLAALVSVACGGGEGEASEATGASASTMASGSGSTGESTGGTPTSTDEGPTGSASAPGTSVSASDPGTGGPTSDPGTGGPTSDPGTGGPTSDPGTGGPTSDPGTTSETGGELCEAEDHQGKATYYAADGSGNCSFDADPGNPMVAAMNHPDYMASAACGACVQVDGPEGQIVVKIVDRCPECEAGHIDLSEGAFAMIAEPKLGVVPITWRYVSCDVQGPIVYHFKEGSNQWWTAVQIRNHRNAIASFAFKDDKDQWVEVPRLEYNYFVADQGMGPGPYEFRVTDVQGNVLEDSGIAFVEAGDSPGAGQFPACMP